MRSVRGVIDRVDVDGAAARHRARLQERHAGRSTGARWHEDRRSRSRCTCWPFASSWGSSRWPASTSRSAAGISAPGGCSRETPVGGGVVAATRAAGGARRGARRRPRAGAWRWPPAARRRADAVPADLLARRLRVSGDLPSMSVAPIYRGWWARPVRAAWTAEQREAIERRSGDLLLDAGAGSGKTSVLVERFVRAGARRRRRGLGDPRHHLHREGRRRAARPDPAAPARARRRRGGPRRPRGHSSRRSTASVPACCAPTRWPRGSIPAFAVLDRDRGRAAGGRRRSTTPSRSWPRERCRVARRAPRRLRRRGAARRDHGRLRRAALARAAVPRPAAAAAAADAGAPALRSSTGPPRRRPRELGASPSPRRRVLQALDRARALPELLERRRAEVRGRPTSTAQLPGGNGAALSHAACAAYVEALDRFRAACEHRRGGAGARAARSLAGHLRRALRRAQARASPRSTSRIWS